MAEGYKLSYPIPASARMVHGRNVIRHLINICRRLPAFVYGRRDVRSPRFSASEYEDRWQQQQQQRTWQRYRHVADYLASRKGRGFEIMALMEGNPYRVDIADFYHWRAKKIGHILQRFYDLNQPIVELGCGYGKNLLALWDSGFRNLIGYDVSPSGVDMVREQAAHFGLQLHVDTFDLTDLSHPAWEELAGTVVFTHYALEQLPQHIQPIIARLVEAQPCQILHIEPMFELLRPSRSLADLETWLHMYLKDYQTSLLKVLTAQQSRQRLEILDIIPLRFSPELRSSPTLIRWRPTNRQQRGSHENGS